MDALIVAGTLAQQHVLSDILHDIEISCLLCTTAAEARRESLCRPFGIFIVNGGLSDERGNELCLDLAENSACGGVYIDDFTRVDMFGDDLLNAGVLSLTRPVTRSDVSEAVRIIAAANVRARQLKAEVDELTAKLEDVKYIFRAKIALMRTLGYTEDQAHKYIEKKSMEQRRSMRAIAMDILKTNEAL